MSSASSWATVKNENFSRISISDFPVFDPRFCAYELDEFFRGHSIRATLREEEPGFTRFSISDLLYVSVSRFV